MSVVVSGLLAAAAVASPPVVGLHVPWAAGGLHRQLDGSVTDAPEEWPSFAVPALRLWDTHTTWADLEPAEGRYDFSHLDAQLAVAHEHGTSDILLVLAGTPAWAAADPSAAGAPWLPSGSASPPEDLAAWRAYVSTVAARYRGQVSAYQIGNEPNLRWFWQGNAEQLHEIVAAAAEEIHRVDPDATVVAPGPMVTNPESVTRSRRWWQAMAGTGVDALALQWYPNPGTEPGILARVVEAVRGVSDDSSLRDLPVWVTEVNHQVPEQATPRDQRHLVTGTEEAAVAAGVARVYWYAWTALGPPGLLELQRGSPAARALAALSRGSFLEPPASPGSRRIRMP